MSCNNEPEESDCHAFDGSPVSQPLYLSAIEMRGGGRFLWGAFKSWTPYIKKKKSYERVCWNGALQALLGFLSSWNGTKRLGREGGLDDREVGGKLLKSDLIHWGLWEMSFWETAFFTNC